MNDDAGASENTPRRTEPRASPRLTREGDSRESVHRRPERDGTFARARAGSEIAKGNSFFRSDALLSWQGKGARQLTTGRCLQYEDVPHNRSLVSLCRMIGATTSRRSAQPTWVAVASLDSREKP
jgi:hypothetical protein